MELREASGCPPKRCYPTGSTSIFLQTLPRCSCPLTTTSTSVAIWVIRGRHDQELASVPPHCSLLNMAAYNEGKQRFLYLASWERLLRRGFTLMGR
jgi:hypothetical protein